MSLRLGSAMRRSLRPSASQPLSTSTRSQMNSPRAPPRVSLSTTSGPSFRAAPPRHRAPAPNTSAAHAHSSGQSTSAPSAAGLGLGSASASTSGSSLAGATGAGSGSGQRPRPSTMSMWYREIVPAMVPVFLLSTTIFLALSLSRTHLSHQRSLAESAARIEALETELARARAARRRARERERRERERILPLVVERVLQRVGAMSQPEADELDEAPAPLLV